MTKRKRVIKMGSCTPMDTPQRLCARIGLLIDVGGEKCCFAHPKMCREILNTGYSDSDSCKHYHPMICKDVRIIRCFCNRNTRITLPYVNGVLL